MTGETTGAVGLAKRLEKGPVRQLCDEIGFAFDRRLERSDVLIAFAAELLAEIDQERSIMAHVGAMGGTPPSEGSQRALEAAWAMLESGTDAERIKRAAIVHDLCWELNPESAYPTDHLIDMVNSIASAVRFGLEKPCKSRHAASAANHVWKQLYGVSRFDSMTPAWEKDWARSKLTGALIALASPTPSPREQALEEALRVYVRAGERYFIPNVASLGALHWPRDEPFSVTVKVADAIRARALVRAEGE